MRATRTNPHIPTFNNEEEEREFWGRHDATEFFDETEEVTEPLVYAGPVRGARRQGIELKLERGSVRQLSRLAKARRVRVEDLVHQWVAERLAQES